MLKLNRKTEYALLALGHLEHRHSEGTVKVREISDAYRIPFPVLAKVMQRLTREGYLIPVHGSGGGYRLSADLAERNLWTFLEMMEGPLGITDCFMDADCTQLESCTIRSPLAIIDHKIRSVFNRLTLREVTSPSVPAFPSPGPPALEGVTART